ncbi:MAG TPA: HlyD family efflux transporter periplasmic adaptor subunit [Propionicimonas sp.]|jgi:multidrug resistance efflux pump|nr:HlyD family efflux transporter periplasmic adaptor subunit [Propionicimonas sp.]
MSTQQEEAIVTEPDTQGPGQPEFESEPVPGKAKRRPLKKRTRIAAIVIGAVAAVSAVLLVTSWAVNSSRYVSTDNAQVDGIQISVNAPTSGILTNWTAQLGSQLHAGTAVGRVAVQSGYMQPQLVVRAPAEGVVAVNNGVNGAFVTAGTQLAVAYDPASVFVTARVDETEIDKVRVGESVDLTVDAFPGTPLTGRVVEIKNGAAGVFSLFPQSNSTGNFQKVTQVIPVKVAVDDRQGLALVPGMNVTARIHRQ